ncbi:splicing factor 3A subunit 2-like [Macrobrachium rosenbergii]|uniref:splicing factor 3A subunit 2-like n=1 Tax=Macrobrachium rosenbergii TaxID=79674 RepID=UPI0034D3C0D3
MFQLPGLVNFQWPPNHHPSTSTGHTQVQARPPSSFHCQRTSSDPQQPSIHQRQAHTSPGQAMFQHPGTVNFQRPPNRLPSASLGHTQVQIRPPSSFQALDMHKSRLGHLPASMAGEIPTGPQPPSVRQPQAHTNPDQATSQLPLPENFQRSPHCCPSASLGRTQVQAKPRSSFHASGKQKSSPDHVPASRDSELPAGPYLPSIHHPWAHTSPGQATFHLPGAVNFRRPPPTPIHPPTSGTHKSMPGHLPASKASELPAAPKPLSIHQLWVHTSPGQATLQLLGPENFQQPPTAVLPPTLVTHKSRPGHLPASRAREHTAVNIIPRT